MGVASLQLSHISGHPDVTCYWNLWSEFSLMRIRAWKLKSTNLVSLALTFIYPQYDVWMKCLLQHHFISSQTDFMVSLPAPNSDQCCTVEDLEYNLISTAWTHFYPVNYDTKRSYESLPINIKHNLRVEQMLEQCWVILSRRHYIKGLWISSWD